MIASEVKRRFRSVAWYVVLGGCAVVLLLVTLFASSLYSTFSHGGGAGHGLYSTVVYTALALMLIASPALTARTMADVRSRHAAAGSRQGAVRVVFAGLVAAWVGALGFVAIALPFLIVTAASGGVSVVVFAVSLLMLLVETLLVTAIARGAAGIVTSRSLSVVLAYAAVGLLTVATLIVFWGVGNSAQIATTVYSRSVSTSIEEPGSDCETAIADGATECASDGDGYYTSCGAWVATVEMRPRLDYAWWVLAVNPFVVVADATPTVIDDYGHPADLFGSTKVGLGQAQQAGAGQETLDSCTVGNRGTGSGVQELIQGTATVWFVGLLVQVLFGGALLSGAATRIRRSAADTTVS